MVACVLPVNSPGKCISSYGVDFSSLKSVFLVHCFICECSEARETCGLDTELDSVITHEISHGITKERLSSAFSKLNLSISHSLRWQNLADFDILNPGDH